ncbi:MAG TPA: hypothetical protein VNJ08_17865 [Bacteriovoracaceae bacterium]|nr:hypothetical protein [Bacteriovoracaceae bacterium]
MVKIILLILFCASCSRLPLKKTPDDQVSINAALDQAQTSYLKGCVQAYESKSEGPKFVECREKAVAHRLELQQMMDYNEEKPVRGL